MMECSCGYKSETKFNFKRHTSKCQIPIVAQLKRHDEELTRRNDDLRRQNEDLRRQNDELAERMENGGNKRKRNEQQRKNKKITIYIIIEKATSKVVYVGQTCNLKERWRQHSSYKSQCRLVRKAFLKEGKASFEIQALMYCNEADADKNESFMITKLNTIYPNGLNLRCGNMAGEEDGYALAERCTEIVAFKDACEETEATAEAWNHVAEMLKEGDNVEDTCKKWLKEVHPDVAKQETYTNTEVAAMLNDIRNAAARTA